MFPEISDANSRPWIPGPYPGVDLCLLEKDPSTGGLTVLRRFHHGITVPAHTHPLADEFVYILSGEWEEEGEIYGTGSVLRVPRGVRHGPHHARTEVISLTRFNGPLTVS